MPFRPMFVSPAASSSGGQQPTQDGLRHIFQISPVSIRTYIAVEIVAALNQFLLELCILLETLSFKIIWHTVRHFDMRAIHTPVQTKRETQRQRQTDRESQKITVIIIVFIMIVYLSETNPERNYDYFITICHTLVTNDDCYWLYRISPYNTVCCY